MDAAKYSSLEAANRAMKEAQSQQFTNQAGIGRAMTSEPFGCRTPLRDRIYRQMEESNMQARKLERLSELAGLLEKNSEVARILDLLEDVRG